MPTVIMPKQAATNPTASAAGQMVGLGISSSMAASSRSSISASQERRPEVDDAIDEHPQAVDEVPVQADELQAGLAAVRDGVAEGGAEQGQHHQQAHDDMHAMDTGEGEEGAGPHVARRRHLLPEQLQPLVQLAPEEDRAQHHSDAEP